MRIWIAGLFLCGGMLFFIFSLIGFYRLNYVMNRIHAAALADTLGLGLVMVGLMILGKDVFHIAKHLLVLFFFWASAPIATHLIGKVEMLTKADYYERVHEK